MIARSENSGQSRHTFNGKEYDREFGWQDYGKRMYNPNLIRFPTVDPLVAQYPWFTPYQFAGNTPIQAIDLDGLEPVSMIYENGKLTKPMVTLLNAAFNYSKTSLQNATWLPYTANASTQAWASLVGIPSKTAASVMGTTVVHDNDQQRADARWFGLIIHEQSHEVDIENQGNTSFYTQYINEGIFKDYHDITTEKDAYKMGSSSGGGYSGQLLKYQNGDVLNILNDPNLSEVQKEAALVAFGSKFKRDVILRDKLDFNNSIIEATDLYLKKNKNLSQKVVQFNKDVITQLQKENSEIVDEQEKITEQYGD